MIPKRLYEELPYLYLLIALLGLLLSASADSLLGCFCSFVLVLLASHIFKMRRDYRFQQWR